MMLRVNGLFLDFNDDIELEKHAKVFEAISETIGDFSYSFTLAKTARNLKILGIQSVDIALKPIYKDVECEVIDNDGLSLYRGLLRVERINEVIECGFYSGNYNWISQISGNLSELDFSAYDINLTEANIIASFSLTDGVVFPLIDYGTLITRSTANLKVEDFSGCIYVKTIFKKIFQGVGIKIKGELINDYIYNNAIICKNNKNPSQIFANQSYVEKNTTTARPLENMPYKVTFQNDSVYPYYDGENDPFDLPNSRYVSPIKQKGVLEVNLRPSVIDASYNNRIYIYINGIFTFVDIGLPVGGLYNSGTPGDHAVFTYKQTIELNQGDVVEIYSEWQQSTGSTQNDVLSGTFKFTPLYLYRVYGNSTVPNWTKQDFVSNFINLFNVVTDYDPVSKELTLNFFDRIKSKPYTDISSNIEIIESDFEEFISNYGRKNYFKYDEGSDEELRDYNVTQFIKYGSGVIEIENDFIKESVNVVEVDFKSPISYINGALDASLERINILSLDADDRAEITSVTDSAGVARFNISSDFYLVGDLVRIKDASLSDYNGDYVVSARGTGYIELENVAFIATSVGEISLLNYSYSDTDDVFLFLNIPSYALSKFSSLSAINLGAADYSTFAYAYFNLLNTGRQVNTDFKQSLSFGGIDNPLSYQRTLIDMYWSNFGSILSDPVKLKGTAYFKKNRFLLLSPLNPVFIKTLKSSNLYYINQILGYKNSYTPCDIELIKL